MKLEKEKKMEPGKENIITHKEKHKKLEKNNCIKHTGSCTKT